MRRRMNVDRWRATHEGVDQLRDGQLPPEKSFRGGKTTSVFESVPEEDRKWFARRYRRALSLQGQTGIVEGRLGIAVLCFFGARHLPSAPKMGKGRLSNTITVTDRDES